LDLI
jgi:8-oxo-dGTP pyrophosphatase MutT (NUDIX family)